MLVVEYELSNKDVKGLPDEGPSAPIWFEGRIQALDFQVDGEDVALWVASNISARHQLEMQLRELCDTDQLTGLFNRRKLESTLQQHYESMLTMTAQDYSYEDALKRADTALYAAKRSGKNRVISA